MNRAELRALAEAATPGPWEGHTTGDVAAWMVYGEDGWVVASACVVENKPGERHLPAFTTIEDGLARADANALFIAATDPTTVIALLDRLEAAEAHLWLITTAKANGDDEQGRIIEARAFLAEDTP